MIHYVTTNRASNFVYCGGDTFGQRSGVTIDKARITCLTCKRLLDDAAEPARSDSAPAPQNPPPSPTGDT